MNGKTIGRPMEILLVEDSLVQAHLTYNALKEAKFEHRLTVVLDGQDALEFLHKVGKYRRVPSPDLILLDLRLPKVDGLEVLMDIKGRESLRQIPVIVMTASLDEEDRVRCASANVDAYLQKPVDLEKFLKAISELRHFWSREELILPQ